MNYEEALVAVLEVLEKHDIPYMVTGSFASSFYGVPRATNDADIVVEITSSDVIENLLRDFDPNFYASRRAAEEAVEMRRIFNVIHIESGFKVDFIIKKARDYSAVELERRQRREFLTGEFWITAPEDVILNKLEWMKAGAGEKQLQDALAVARVRAQTLDWQYLREWAGRLEVSDLLEEIEMNV